MFAISQVLVVNKLDLLPYVDYDLHQVQGKEQDYGCFDCSTCRGACADYARPDRIPINATRYPALSAYAVDVRRIARARDQVRYA